MNDFDCWEALLSEAGSDFRARAATLWNAGQFYITIVAALLAVTAALWGQLNPTEPAWYSVMAVLGLLGIAVFAAVMGQYTLISESFHFALSRRFRNEMVRAGSLRHEPLPTWLVELQTSDIGSPESLASALEAVSSRGSLVPAKFFDTLHNEVIPGKGVRYSLRRILDLLILGSLLAMAYPTWVMLSELLQSLHDPSVAALGAVPATGGFLMVYSGLTIWARRSVRLPFRNLHRDLYRDPRFRRFLRWWYGIPLAPAGRPRVRGLRAMRSIPPR